MFEGIKIVSTLDCVWGFVPKSWINVRESKLTVVSRKLDILIFENYLSIEIFSLLRHQKLHLGN